jgi:hypothetical protein
LKERKGIFGPAVEPVAVLETFLGRLAAKDYSGAYSLVAPSSKKNGDPIAYHIPVDFRSFLAELEPFSRPLRCGSTESQTLVCPNNLYVRKFARYAMGGYRWENASRFRIVVVLDGWDTDEVLLVREDGRWYVADPIHIIR